MCKKMGGEEREEDLSLQWLGEEKKRNHKKNLSEVTGEERVLR